MESSPDRTSSRLDLESDGDAAQPPAEQSTADQQLHPADGTTNGEGAEEPNVEKSASNNASGSGKIFIGGLSRDTSTDKLTKHFKTYGEIIDSVIMRDRATGHPRGFGFVTYADPAVCERVMKDTHVLDGKTVELKKSIPREMMVKGPKTKKIFVGGIPTSVTEEEFKNYFAKFGKIVEHQIMHDHASGRSRGFGFVTFDSEQVVDELLVQGKSIELGGKQVEVKKAEPKKLEPPPGSRGTYRGSAHGGYSDYGPYSGSYKSGSGGYGPRAGGYSGYSGYGRGGYGSPGYGGASYGALPVGGFGSGMSYGGGYGGSMLGGYGDMDGYLGSAPYGGYGSGAYGSYGGDYGSSRYDSGPSGRYHPYSRS